MQTIHLGTGQVRNIIAIASGKGGVGKSTVTTNLALTLKQQGYQVGVLDADLYGPSQALMFGRSEKANIENGYCLPVDRNGIKFISMSAINAQDGAVVVRAPIALKIISQFLNSVLWGDLDYLLIDLPPGTGDIQLSLAQQVKLNGVVIVTTPQKVAIEISRKGLEMFNTVNVPILGVVENMSGFTCSHCEKVTAIFKEAGGAKLAQEQHVPFLGAIPLNPLIMMSADEGVSLFEANENSLPAQAFKHIAERLNEELENVSSPIVPIETIVSKDTGKLKIRWSDDQESELDPYSLRVKCPCASCVDEDTGKKIIKEKDVSSKIGIKEVRTVGQYGLGVTFSDGHSTGIYKYSHLR